MKRLAAIITAILSVALFSTASAQQDADRILGVFNVVKGQEVSKVRFTKNSDGSYKGQVIWVKNPKDKNGNVRTDHRNPDAAKRSTPADQIVLIEKVTYENGEWKNGKIYDPTNGKSYKVVMNFDENGVLIVKGFLGPFSQKFRWTRLE